MKDSKRSSEVLRASAGAYLRRVKSCVQEDRHIKGDVKLKTPHCNAFRSKNHLAWYVALNAKPSEENLSHIPLINWKCPPKFVLDHVWRVASGEGSMEVEAQKYRETTVIEAVYSHPSDIPPSPSISLQTGDEYCKEVQIPLISITPIEESAAVETLLDTLPAGDKNTCISSQLQCPFKGRLASGNLTISQCKSSVSQDPSANGKSLHNVLCDLESSDLEVAAAAAATVAAVMQSKQDIDTELLIKFLSDPVMIKKLINENKIDMRTIPGIISGSKPSTSTTLSNMAPGSVSRPVSMKQSLPMHVTEVETVINISEIKQGETAALDGEELVCMPIPMKKASTPPSRSNCQANLIKKLTDKAMETAFTPSGIQKSGGGLNHVRPLIFSTLNYKENKFGKTKSDYGGPITTAGVKLPALSYYSISKPSVVALKPRINKHWTPTLAGMKTVDPPPPQISTARTDMEERRKMISEYRAPDYPNCLMHTSTSLASALESKLTSTGIFNTLPFSSRVEFSHTEEKINYCRSLIKNHGKNHETEGHNFGQPSAQMHPNERINPGYQMPCMIANSYMGHRNGSNGPYGNDMPRHMI